jgi:hypothetical protein
LKISGSFPQIIEPELSGAPALICSWIDSNRDTLFYILNTSGAILLRGFSISDNITFRKVCTSITPDLRNYIGGDSPRVAIDDQIYTSTEYNNDLEVLLHNELSYGGWFPNFVMFGCMQPANIGGATHIADGRKILKDLPKDLVERFSRNDITYLQYLPDKNHTSEYGKTWQETFETDNAQQVSGHLIKSQIKYEWTPFGLRTRATRPAIQIHPHTLEVCWHNQADQWHRELSSIKDSVFRDSSDACDKTAGTKTFGSHACFGNGEEISADDLLKIRQVSQKHEVLFNWQKGDLLILDNILTMHGRKPYSGERRIIVAMS